jgi:predicted ester cyclase
MIDHEVTRRVVAAFLADVRSGRDPGRAAELMAPVVLAHQVESEHEVTIERSPDDYAAHVREMRETWGDFRLEVDEFLVDGARAYVRLTQTGRHLAAVDGHAATGRTVRQINSVVYHVEDGVITQYWMQIDRAGLLRQLR